MFSNKCPYVCTYVCTSMAQGKCGEREKERKRGREREREFHHFLPRRYDKQVTLKRTDSTKSYLKLEKLVSTI